MCALYDEPLRSLRHQVVIARASSTGRARLAPHGPNGGACFYDFVMSVQGGGVYVRMVAGTVTFDNCNIHSNTASYVSNAPPHATFPMRRREAC